MLLMQLKNREKFAFLHIAHYLANADGKFEKKEKSMIKDYCIEMGIDDIFYEKDNFSLDECLSQFHSIKSQKILLLELMILVHADDKFNNQEVDIINVICTKFDINKTQVRYASTWGKAISSLREQALLMIE